MSGQDHEPGAGPGAEPGRAGQRVRVGLIGLTGVVGLIGLAGAALRGASHEPPVAAADAPRAAVVANLAANAQADAAEPLAELGVTPLAGNGQAAYPTR